MIQKPFSNQKKNIIFFLFQTLDDRAEEASTFRASTDVAQVLSPRAACTAYLTPVVHPRAAHTNVASCCSGLACCAFPHGN